MGDRTLDLPGSLRLGSALPFVGRSGELARLRTLMPMAAGEGRRLALLAGEPGSGKSRLVREFAAAAAADGALVLYGACDAVVQTPYGPFVEALDRLVRALEPERLRTALGPGGGELTRLLPDLSARVGELREPVAADPDTERLRLHTAVAELLAGAGRERPLLLVIEDGHWADRPTLLLLRHLARSAWDARLLILGTFRDTEAEMPRGLAETLADLRRSEAAVRLRLDGLSPADVAEFVERAAGHELDRELRELAAAVHGLTEGNPFLVCELWRAAVETGVLAAAAGRLRLARPLSELGTPESVREVAAQRLARLEAPTTLLLELAATAGSEFGLETVRRAAGLDEPELLAALEQAVASGMLEELPAQALSCRFAHELVRRAVYDGLPRTRRAELHLRVGEALAGGEESGRVLADLAHHFAAAAPLGGVERAVDYNLRAALAASSALAFEEAALRLRSAIELGIEGPRERAGAFLELGWASYRAGKEPEALEAFSAAAEIAREQGSAGLLARAAIGYEDACWRPGLADRETVELLEEALAALGEEEAPELRVGLLSALARVLDRRGERELALARSAAAIELARRSGDRAGLARVLTRSYWSRGTTPHERILAMLTEAMQIGEELGDVEIRAEAMGWRVPTYVALGDLASARREGEAGLEIAEQTAQPFVLHITELYRAAIALCDGRFAEAEAMAGRSHEWSSLLTGRDASAAYGIQMFSIRREQGRLAELAPAIRILAGKAERDGPWRPGLAVLLAELGMEEEARRELARLGAAGIDRFRDSLWLATLAYLADAAAALAHEGMAALVYPELEPYAGSNLVIGHLVACYGAADRYLGMLAAVLGEAELAAAHFERALELNREMEAPVWIAHTAYEYGRLLRGRGGEDRERAEALLGEASALAERHGMGGLLAKARAFGVAAGGGLPDGLSPREAQILELVARGLSNREIGERLTISEHTAANHVRSILRKTGCANRTEAASYAHLHGLASR